ncbi:MAG: NADH pyrophosphatase [Geoglossum simile]|nr:MAG: NADH pyrophosphatase [Geoglossum simile]
MLSQPSAATFEGSNYFSGSPLNRVAFLRSDHSFLSYAFRHPSTNFILFNNLAPFTTSPSCLAYVSYADVSPLVGEDPFAKSEEEMLREFSSEITAPLVLFLGLDEGGGGVEWGSYKGTPHFAVDVTPRGASKDRAEGLMREMEARGWELLSGRVNFLDAPQAAIYAQARSLLDWNARNPFCASCGSKTLSINAGYKRTCPPTDLAPLMASQTRPPCTTRTGLHNLAFPRTDPTVIVAVVSASGNSVLLGRKHQYPPNWYSTLAGFIESGESAEEAIRREVWEESGVKVARVVLHSTQPWPYPASLMIGAVAQSVAGAEEIHLKHDPELEDAKWVSIEEITEALKIGTGWFGEGPGPEYKEGGLRLPPSTAIANKLLVAVVGGLLSGDSRV